MFNEVARARRESVSLLLTSILIQWYNTNILKKQAARALDAVKLDTIPRETLPTKEPAEDADAFDELFR